MVGFPKQSQKICLLFVSQVLIASGLAVRRCCNLRQIRKRTRIGSLEIRHHSLGGGARRGPRIGKEGIDFGEDIRRTVEWTHVLVQLHAAIAVSNHLGGITSRS